VGHLKKDELLYIAIPPILYAHYSGGKAYPDAEYPFPTEVSKVPDYTNASTQTAGMGTYS
jgi:hypothetical protein